MTAHPLLRAAKQRPKIHTKPVSLMATAIKEALMEGHAGIHVDSRARDGKTRAAELLSEEHFWMDSDHPTRFFTIPRRSKSSDAIFYKLIQQQLKLSQSSQSAAVDRLEQISTWCAIECAKYGNRTIAFFIDEAQLLTMDDYEYLANIENRLAIDQITLFCVFVHQSDDPHAEKNLVDPEKLPPHISGRFFMAEHFFSGLRGIEDIAHALDQYDSIMTFEGKTFTEYFAPKAFGAGWRFSTHATQFYAAIQQLRAEHGFQGGADLAMKIFEPAVCKLLTKIAGSNPDFTHFTDDEILWAIDSSGYVRLERSRARQRPKKVIA